MNAIQTLLTEHIDIWTDANTEKKSGRGRASGNAASVYGIKKLRELILELAVRGKLVLQDPNDEPASVLLKRIHAEKTKLIAEGKIKKDKPLPPITDEEKPFELPHGWEWVRLGVVTQKLTDGSHNPPKDVGSGLPMLSSQNINFGEIDFNSPSRFVSEEDFEVENSRTKIESNDVLLTIVGSLGRPAVVPINAPKFVLQRSVAVIKTELFAEFLCIQLGSPLCIRYYELHGKGTAQKGIYLGQLSIMPIAVPSTREQHRIVAKVDELMALCDQLETQHNNAVEAHEKLVSHLLGTLTQSQNAEDFSANWQRIAAHFDTLFTSETSIDALKQTLLQLAVMGKLVPQDPDDEPASELLKSIRTEKAKLIAEGVIKKDKPQPPIVDDEKPFVPPPGWAWVRLGEITSIRGGSTPSMSISEYWGGKIPWISPKDMHDGNIVDSELRITEKALKESSLELVPVGSILIVGRSGILKRKLPAQITAVPCTVNQDLKAVTPIKPLSDRYMQLIFWGNEKEILDRDVKQGTTVQSLVYESLFSRPFSLPPAREQHRIVAKVDELMALCDQLKTSITQANQLQQKLADVLAEQAVA